MRRGFCTLGPVHEHSLSSSNPFSLCKLLAFTVSLVSLSQSCTTQTLNQYFFTSFQTFCSDFYHGFWLPWCCISLKNCSLSISSSWFKNCIGFVRSPSFSLLSWWVAWYPMVSSLYFFRCGWQTCEAWSSFGLMYVVNDLPPCPCPYILMQFLHWPANSMHLS